MVTAAGSVVVSPLVQFSMAPDRRPMSLVETGVSSGAVSLRQLVAGELQATADPGLSLQDCCALFARGGWPAQQGRPWMAASRAARDDFEPIRQVFIRWVRDRCLGS